MQRLAGWPDSLWEALVALCGLVERIGLWPTDWPARLVALLPKEGTLDPMDRRPVVLLPAYRLCVAARRRSMRGRLRAGECRGRHSHWVPQLRSKTHGRRRQTREPVNETRGCGPRSPTTRALLGSILWGRCPAPVAAGDIGPIGDSRPLSGAGARRRTCSAMLSPRQARTRARAGPGCSPRGRRPRPGSPAPWRATASAARPRPGALPRARHAQTRRKWAARLGEEVGTGGPRNRATPSASGFRVVGRSCARSGNRHTRQWHGRSS